MWFVNPRKQFRNCSVDKPALLRQAKQARDTHQIAGVLDRKARRLPQHLLRPRSLLMLHQLSNPLFQAHRIGAIFEASHVIIKQLVGDDETRAKKKQSEQPDEQSKGFTEEVQRMIDAGELNLIEAD